MSLISEFVSKFQDGIRANLFVAFIDDLDPVYVQSMQIPGVTINTYDLFYNLFLKKYAISQDFDPITINFLLDAPKMKAYKKFMLEWKNSIINQKTGFISYRNDYIKDIFLGVLDTKENIVLSAKLLKSFPINIGNIDFDYKNTNTFVELSVTFVFENVEYTKF